MLVVTVPGLVPKSDVTEDEVWIPRLLVVVAANGPEELELDTREDLTALTDEEVWLFKTEVGVDRVVVWLVRNWLVVVVV